MQQYAIIVAGGTGSRMQNSIPKQFLPICGKPIIYYSIHTFLKTFADINFIIVVHKDYLNTMQDVLNLFPKTINIQIVNGGNTRFESVKNGLHNVPNNTDTIVYIHDAARPFINTTLLNNLQQCTLQNGNAIPAITVNESVRIYENNISKPIDRTTLRIIQTPQVFIASTIIKCFDVPYQQEFTDEATVVQLAGNKIFLCDGLDENIKITTPNQLLLAEWMMQNWR